MNKVSVLLCALSIFLMIFSFGLADGSGYSKIEYDMLEDGTLSIRRIVPDTKKMSKTIEVPSEIDGHTVTEIQCGAFDMPWDDKASNRNFVSTIVFPDTINSIPGNPFDHLLSSSVQAIRVSNDHPYLAVIDGSLFSKPDKRLIFHKQEEYGDSKSYAIPKGIQIVGKYAFSWGYYLEEVTLPDSVITIADYAFYSCDSLNNIVFSKAKNLETIGASAFKDCSYLRSISLPNGVLTIGDEAFSRCIRLSSFDIPDSVISLGSGLFYGSRSSVFNNPKGIKSFNISKNVTEISGNIGNVVISVSADNKRYKIINGYLVDVDEMKLIQPIIEEDIMTIPDGIKVIGKEAFTDEWKIKEIYIPNTVEAIEAYAFRCKGLEKIVIPSSVTAIGFRAFSGNSTTFVVEAGSFAEEYAQERDYSYIYSTSATDWLND